MSVSQEIRDYFSKLIEPLAANADLRKLFEKMKGETVEKFETKFEEQNNEIIESKSRVAVKENIINNLLIKCDDNEQYSSRSCLRIHGIACDNENMLEKVQKMLQGFGFTFLRRIEYTTSARNINIIKILEKHKSITIKF